MRSDRANMASYQERFEYLLPFYITGQLAHEDREFVESHVASHGDAAAAFGWLRECAGW